MRRKRRFRNVGDEAAWIEQFKKNFEVYFRTNDPARRSIAFHRMTKDLEQKETEKLTSALLALSEGSTPSEKDAKVQTARKRLEKANNKDSVFDALSGFNINLSIQKADEQETQIKKKARQEKRTETKLFEDLTSSLRQITQDTSDENVQLLLTLYLLLQLPPGKLGGLSDDIAEIIGDYRTSSARGSTNGKVEGISASHLGVLSQNKEDILKIIKSYEASLTGQDSEGNEKQFDIADTSSFDDDDEQDDLSFAMPYNEFLEKIDILQGKITNNRTARQVAFFASAYYALWKTIASNESLAISVICGKTKIPDAAWLALGTAIGILKKEKTFNALPSQTMQEQEKKEVVLFLQNNSNLKKIQALGLQGLFDAAIAAKTMENVCNEAIAQVPANVRLSYLPPTRYLSKMKKLSNLERIDEKARADDSAMWSLLSWDTDALRDLKKERIPNPNLTTQTGDAAHRLFSLERLLAEAGDDTVFDQETVEVMLDFLLTG